MTLAAEPKYFRSSIVRGSQPKVDREGGYANAGIIRDVAMITEGEALGHETWIDAEFNQSVAAAVNAASKGVKSRFTHPSLSGDGFGKFLGRAMNARIVGDKVLADLHFSKAAHNTPDGDLASYVMDLAEHEPDSFGMSIVFDPDWDAMEDFAAQHSSEHGDFATPDQRNSKNLLHARMNELRAVDAVDEPAANPDGLFHREENAAAEADKLLSYALGISQEKPEVSMFSVDADRVKGFVARFCEQHKIQLQEPSDMATEPLTDTIEETEDQAQVVDETQPEIHTVVDTTTAETADETVEPAAEPVAASSLTEGERFLEAFGDKGGVWYAKGFTFAQAQEKYVAELREENEVLKTKLAAAQAGGEDEPVDFSEAKIPVEKQKVIRIAGKR